MFHNSENSPEPQLVIGELIRARRKELRLSIENLTDRSGIDSGTISRAETGVSQITPANLLQKNLSSLSSSVEYQISIIDQKDYFMMGLVNLWILSGIRTLEDSKIDLNRLENRGIRYLNDKVTEIDVTSKTVTIRGLSTLKLKYDYLIIAWAR